MDHPVIPTIMKKTAKPSLMDFDPDKARISYAGASKDPSIKEIALDRIMPRPHKDIRPLKVPHVIELAETIAATGLLQSIVLDSKNRLLAGRHRYAACQLLAGLNAIDGSTKDKEANSTAKLIIEIFEGAQVSPQYQERILKLDSAAFENHHPGTRIPCRIVDIDAEVDQKAAFDIEVVENEKRRDFSKEEIVKLVDRLKSIGYAELSGRPTKGQRPLMPALALIMGKSLRHVHRLLDSPDLSKGQDTEKPKSHLPQLMTALDKAIPELEQSRSAKAREALNHFQNGLKALKLFVESRS